MKDLLKKLASTTPEDYVIDPVASDKQDLLKAMAEVESRQGQDVSHDSDAMGKYGLRPTAIKDAYEHSDLKDKYKLDKLNKQMHVDPAVQDVVASRYYDVLNKSAKDDPNAMAYGWLNGPGAMRRAQNSDEDLANHWHVKKVIQQYEKFKKLTDKIKNK